MKHTIHLIIAALTSQVLATGVPPSDVNIEVRGIPIYCVSLLYTKKPVNEKTGQTANEFRTALSKLVEGRATTDKNLHFIAGDRISSASNLRADNPKDPVHLSEEGAALLADTLYPILKTKEER